MGVAAGLAAMLGELVGVAGAFCELFRLADTLGKLFESVALLTGLASGASSHLANAPARKFLGVVYRTLKHGWVFADFPNFVLAEQ